MEAHGPQQPPLETETLAAALPAASPSASNGPDGSPVPSRERHIQPCARSNGLKQISALLAVSRPDMQGPGPHPGVGSGCGWTGAPAQSTGWCRLPAEPRIVPGFRVLATARLETARLRKERENSRTRQSIATTISSAVRWRQLRKLERSVPEPMSDSPFGRIFPVLAYVCENTSSRLRATTYLAGLSCTARALKCALPHLIFASSLSRRSSVKSPLFVSTTK